VQKPEDKIHPIVEKVICDMCGKFFGYIRENGTGPQFDECDLHEVERVPNETVQKLIANGNYTAAKELVETQKLHIPPCPMKLRLLRYERVRRPTGVGGGRAGPYDTDAFKRSGD